MDVRNCTPGFYAGWASAGGKAALRLQMPSPIFLKVIG
jgi:hypothetical protein